MPSRPTPTNPDFNLRTPAGKAGGTGRELRTGPAPAWMGRVPRESGEKAESMEKQLEILQPPALDIDAILYRDQKGTPHPQGKLERRIVWNLLNQIKAQGFPLALIDDGDEETRVTDPKAAMELIFNLDEVGVYFGYSDAEREADLQNQEAEGTEQDQAPPIHWIRLVIGNGIDIISDYGTGGAFGKFLDGFDTEVYA